MDTNNGRPNASNGEPIMNTTNWITQLEPDFRLRIVNKIMDTLMRHLPYSGDEGLNELKKITVRFEEKMYSAASSQSDYLRRISSKMLTMETKSWNTLPNPGHNNNCPEPGFFQNIMDTNNGRPNAPNGEPIMDTTDWRSPLQPESRQRIVNKIMDTLMRHLPCSGDEGLNELKRIAARFEEKIYNAASSQSDYLRRISLKMLTMETKSQNTLPNPGNNNNPSEPEMGSEHGDLES